MRMTV